MRAWKSLGQSYGNDAKFTFEIDMVGRADYD